MNDSNELVRFAKMVPDAKIPTRATKGSTGLDLYAVEPTWVRGSVTLVRTGIAMEVLKGYDAQVRPRSGLTKNGVILAGIGTIDSDYRGEIGVMLFALSGSWEIRRGERIAQLVISRLASFEIVEVDYAELTSTARDTGGYGSTGA